VDVCSKISDEEKMAWINATMALQQDASINMAVVTTTPEVVNDIYVYLQHLMTRAPSLITSILYG